MTTNTAVLIAPISILIIYISYYSKLVIGYDQTNTAPFVSIFEFIVAKTFHYIFSKNTYRRTLPKQMFIIKYSVTTRLGIRHYRKTPGSFA